jgi:alpha-D-ribose 1-methylphosphonate 5-triphosphate synthase subunit PhnI
MAYVAIRGGERAIAAAAATLDAQRRGQLSSTPSTSIPLEVSAIRDQLHLLTARVCSEGGLWHPDLAALAIKQAAGDPLEASFLLRAYRATRPRLGTTEVHDGRQLRLIRRISAAFKDIPGGQILGPTTDYLQRLFRYELLDEDPTAFRSAAQEHFKGLAAADADELPKVVDLLRAEGLLPPPLANPAPAIDLTRTPLSFPAPRSAALSAMARGETGALLGIAYSAMRGWGYLHPTVAELRVGWLPITWPHPVTGDPIEVGEVPITECEIVTMYDRAAENQDRPRFGLGYGACFGHNEVKAIAMAMLDRSLQNGAERGAEVPAEDDEFVLLHIDGVDAMGFCSHYKMPHYVTFQSDLDRLRTTQRKLDDIHTPDSTEQVLV